MTQQRNKKSRWSYTITDEEERTVRVNRDTCGCAKDSGDCLHAAKAVLALDPMFRKGCVAVMHGELADGISTETVYEGEFRDELERAAIMFEESAAQNSEHVVEAEQQLHAARERPGTIGHLIGGMRDRFAKIRGSRCHLPNPSQRPQPGPDSAESAPTQGRGGFGRYSPGSQAQEPEEGERSPQWPF